MRFGIIFLASVLAALGCSCRTLTVCELIEQPTLFLGEVIEGGITSIRDDPWNTKANHVRFKVLENLRGLPAGAATVDVELHPIPGTCEPVPYFPGKRYLVFPQSQNGKFTDGACFQGRDLEQAAADVRELREYLKGNKAMNVHGRVAAVSRLFLDIPASESYFIQHLLDDYGVKALARATVSVSRNGTVYSTQTSADGSYQFELPASGTYDIHAALDHYTSGRAVELTIAQRGCVVQNFGLTPDNTISGTVWNNQGQPQKHADVRLLDLDRPLPRPYNPISFTYATAQQVDSGFVFQSVPIGRYLLIFNPNGPRTGDPSDQPFESTYYPLNSTRAAAKIIEVKSSGTHLAAMDLVIGKPVKFRQVTVHVRFPDGAPMKTAAVQCTGTTSTQDDDPWIFKDFSIKKTGIFQFSAPANRKLRIEVKDTYNRDLKASYVTIHEPGLAPITQDFVVK